MIVKNGVAEPVSDDAVEEIADKRRRVGAARRRFFTEAGEEVALDFELNEVVRLGVRRASHMFAPRMRQKRAAQP